MESFLRRAGFAWQSSALDSHARLDEREAGLLAVRKAAAAGLFIQAAHLTDELHVRRTDASDAGAGVYRLVRSGGGEAAAAKLRIHHSSALFRCQPAWVCFFSAEQNDTGWCVDDGPGSGEGKAATARSSR